MCIVANAKMVNIKQTLDNPLATLALPDTPRSKWAASVAMLVFHAQLALSLLQPRMEDTAKRATLVHGLVCPVRNRVMHVRGAILLQQMDQPPQATACLARLEHTKKKVFVKIAL